MTYLRHAKRQVSIDERDPLCTTVYSPKQTYTSGLGKHFVDVFQTLFRSLLVDG